MLQIDVGITQIKTHVPIALIARLVLKVIGNSRFGYFEFEYVRRQRLIRQVIFCAGIEKNRGVSVLVDLGKS